MIAVAGRSDEACGNEMELAERVDSRTLKAG